MMGEALCLIERGVVTPEGVDTAAQARFQIVGSD